MTQKTRLVIARHGNTFGPDDVVRRVGITDIPLVATGLMQGQRLGRHLKDHDLIPNVIFTSELQRTQQTAEQAQLAMGTKLPIRPLAIFNEINYGPDEFQEEAQVIARVGQDAMKAWENSAIVPDGWQFDPKQTIAHWQAFASQIQSEFSGQTILVVTSNGIARFAPYLTGDFKTFCQNHHIKLSTGAFGVLEASAEDTVWHCLEWNTKPC